ncbi:BCLAF1 and THRAP3 family member 3 [Echinops telfairi]|uniref:BCLAF1 and THRAP3 family member 3 n=1 Tax=Echinops telfairi TaxID=9371 RepID=A0AC55D4D3_ECHTE|nr:BCLAF1 and THRAP3 family member 3 [Echinops telfairi]
MRRGRGWRPHPKPEDSFIGFEGKWHEDDTFEYPWTREDCGQLPKRGPEDFEARYSLQKRAAATYSKERQMSLDLIASSKNDDKFHPVFEHLKDAPKIERKNPEQFSQDIITTIHQVKENYFPLPDNTLHERFSELQAETGLVIPRSSYSKMHRTIYVPLVGFPNETVGHEPEQSVVKIIQPNDLRHDIERRRRERLQNEGDGDGHDFYIDGAAERDIESRPPNSNLGVLHRR